MDKIQMAMLLQWVGVAGAILTGVYLLISNVPSLIAIIVFGLVYAVGYFIKKEMKRY